MIYHKDRFGVITPDTYVRLNNDYSRKKYFPETAENRVREMVRALDRDERAIVIDELRKIAATDI